MLTVRRISEGERPELGQLEGDQVLIGREPSSGIRIPSKAISREHGVFSCYAQNWFYKDLASTNGSWLNGKQLEKGVAYLLRGGDVLQLADVGIEICGDVHRDSSADFGPAKLVVFSRNEYLQEVVIPDQGRCLVIGGGKADLHLDVDIYDLPSLVVEKRGGNVCAFSIAKDVPVYFNGELLTRTVLLVDRDEVLLAPYRVILSDPIGQDSVAATTAGARPFLPGYSEGEISQSDVLSKRAPNRTFFGRAFDNDEEGGVANTVALDPEEIRRAVVGRDRAPSIRHITESNEPEINFAALEEKILLSIGFVMLFVLLGFAIWWVL